MLSGQQEELFHSDDIILNISLGCEGAKKKKKEFAIPLYTVGSVMVLRHSESY